MPDESVTIVKEECKRHLLPTPSAEVDGDPGGRGRIVDQYRKVQLLSVAMKKYPRVASSRYPLVAR